MQSVRNESLLSIEEPPNKTFSYTKKLLEFRGDFGSPLGNVLFLISGD